MRWRNPRFAAFIFCLPVALCLSLTAHAANISWLGAGGNSDWSTTANWSGGNVPGAGDIVYFSDAAPDAAQSVNLDSAVTIDKLYMTATSNRDYTVSSAGDHALTFNPGAAPAHMAISLESAATADLTFEADLGTAATDKYLYNNSTSSQFVVNGEINPTTRIWLYGGGGGNPLRVNGSVNTSQVVAREVVAGHTNALGQGRVEFYGDAFPKYSLVTDVSIGNFRTVTASEGSGPTLRTWDTDEMRVITATDDFAAPTQSDRYGTIFFGPDAHGGAGDVGLYLPAPGRYYELPFDFQDQSDAYIHFAADSSWNTLRTRERQDANGTTYWSSVISGAGWVLKTGGAELRVQTVQEYTGGTVISNGSIRLMANTVHPDWASGQLPDTGTVYIAAAGLLDLNGFDDTIGGLAGNGMVVGSNATLTVNDSLSPGASVGTLTVSNATLSLGSGLIYSYEMSHSGPDDLVQVYSNITFGADLTLELALADPETVVAGDQFVLFAYSGSTDISGLNWNFLEGPGTSILNLGSLGNGNVTDTGSQIVLSGVHAVIPEPASALLVLLGALALRGLSSRRRDR